MDSFMLGVFELHVNKAHHNTIASLMVRFKEVMGNLDNAVYLHRDPTPIEYHVLQKKMPRVAKRHTGHCKAS
jgi:hypothetical protein